MNTNKSHSSEPQSRFDALDFARALAIIGMLGSHLVGIEGGTTPFENGLTAVLSAIEPVVAAMFCVVAGISWSIQAERVGVTANFRRYFLQRALALGLFGVLFHVSLWSTDILLPFAQMMTASLFVLGRPPRTTALALLLVIAVTPVVGYFVAPYEAADWFENGLHVADYSVGWASLRYLLVDGNYPLISWVAFPLMGMVFWQSWRDQKGRLGWILGSLGAVVVTWAVAVYSAPAGGLEEASRWMHEGWTPTSMIFVLFAGGGSLLVVSASLKRWGTEAMPRALQPLVLFGRASLSHYVLHLAIAYSLLRLWYPDEIWPPITGLWAMLAYLAIGLPLTTYWFHHHKQGPLETLWARASRRPGRDTNRAKPSTDITHVAGLASLHAARSFAKGDIVFELLGERVRQATRFTIQVGLDLHLDPVSERTSPWRYLNHGCDPNVAIDVRRRVVFARRPIAAREELRFDYNTTEWELAESFVCNCGAPDCVGVAMGFAHLSPARQEIMFGQAAPHIRVLYARRLREIRQRQTVLALTPVAEG